MKATTMNDRPNYKLLKQSDIVSFYHMQFPRWLMEDSRYCGISLEAKFTYMLLFNRFQLSKHNSWINEDGEVFIIYTRQELALKLNVGEKRISSAFAELKKMGLVWERRCGRGFANQIYLANVKISEQDAVKSTSGPMDKLPDIISADETDDIRPVEMAVLDEARHENKDVSTFQDVNSFVDNSPKNVGFTGRNVKLTVQDPPNRAFKNSQNSGSKTAISAVQDPPEQRPIYKDFELKNNDFNKSQSMSVESLRRDDDRRAESRLLESILEQTGVSDFEKDESTLLTDAIERLFFSESIRIGSAIYPKDRIRSNLQKLDGCIAQDALFRIEKNRENITNSSAYVTTVLFNTIMESNSDLLVDPYLNFLRSRHRIDTCEAGGSS